MNAYGASRRRESRVRQRWRPGTKYTRLNPRHSELTCCDEGRCLPQVESEHPRGVRRTEIRLSASNRVSALDAKERCAMTSNEIFGAAASCQRHAREPLG